MYVDRQRQLTSLLRSRSYSRGSRSTSWAGGVVAMERKVSHSSECDRGLSLCSGGLSSPWTLLTPWASSPWTALSSNCRSKSCSLFHWTTHKGNKTYYETNYRMLPSSCLVHQANVKSFTCLHTLFLNVTSTVQHSSYHSILAAERHRERVCVQVRRREKQGSMHRYVWDLNACF